MKDIKIFSGRANLALTEKIYEYLALPLGQIVIGDFPDGETSCKILEDIRGRDQKVPIIMVTTEADKGRVVQAIQAGVSDYLIKPFTAETLREKLDKHVG